MRKFGAFELESLSAGPLSTNTYVLSSGNESILVDSGTDHKEIIEKLSLDKKVIRALIMTHGHFDHIFDAMEFKRKLGCDLMIGEHDTEIMEWSYKVSERYMGRTIEPIEVDRFLRDGDTIPLGQSSVKIISLPGHTMGSIGLMAGPLILTGDVLFRGTIGRTDVGGSMESMNHSLKRLSELDQEILVFPGHGPETTIKNELEKNPFMKDLG